MKRISVFVIALFAMIAFAASLGAQTQVGIVLPTKDEPRWIQDQTRFQDALGKANISAEILFSQGDPAKEKANVEALISKGIKVLVICPQDGAAGVSTVEMAKKAGITVIAYARMFPNTDAVDYYINHDSLSVGTAWGKFLIEKAAGRKGLPLYLYAGDLGDSNAFVFFEGAWKALQPKIADGTFRIVNSKQAVALQKKNNLTRDEQAKIIGEVTTKWNPSEAKNKASANLTVAKKADKGEVFVAAPNDPTARAISREFFKDKDVTKVWITGQDVEKSSVQMIIDGTQSMTVFKDVRDLISATMTTVQAVLAGKKPTTNAINNNGKKDIPMMQSDVIVITRDNIKKYLIESGYYNASDFEGL